MDEDVKRNFMRQIKKCKSESPFVHYQFAYHLLTKYEQVMDIFTAAESSSSEIDEIKQVHSLCLSSIKEGKELVWLCHDCKKVIGFFKTLPGVEVNLFPKCLAAMVGECPACGSERYLILKSDFLLSGLTIDQALGENKPEIDNEAGAIEMRHISTMMASGSDLKEVIKSSVLISGKSIKDLLREGRIKNLSMKHDDGHWWNVFGKMTPEDINRFGLKEGVLDWEKTINEGFAFLKENRFEEAIQCFDKLLEHESNAAIWEAKGRALDRLNKYEEAVESYDKVLSINEKDSRVWNNKAFILYNHLHRHEEAIECFKKAADLGNPDAKDALKQLGLL
jgi:hypothetical protein